MAMLKAHAEVIMDKEAKENGRLNQAKEAFEKRQMKTAARTAGFERRRNNPLSAEDRQKAMSLLTRHKNHIN